MDEISAGTVSCRSLGWIFDLCVERHIDPLRILKHIPRQRDILQDPAASIDWDSFLTLFFNLGNYLDDEQLMASGARSWKHPVMLPHATVGRLLRNSRTQFEAIYGEEGLLSRLYPVNAVIKDVKYGHIEVQLEMRANLLPCRTFQVLLAGQMAGLTTALGEAPANVHINQTRRGAVYDIWYQPIRGPISRMKRLIGRTAAIRDCARLLDNSQSLLINYEGRLRRSEEKHIALAQKFDEHELRYRLLERSIKDVVITLDESLGIRYISTSIEALCGYTVSEAMSLPPLLLFSEESLDKIRRLLNPSQYPRTADNSVEVEVYRKNGERFWAEFQPAAVAPVKGRSIRLTALIRDISERKHYEADLNEREASYLAITTNALDAIITANEENHIAFANPAAARIFDLEVDELQGRPLTDLMPTVLSVIHVDDRDKYVAPADCVSIGGITRDGGSVALEASFAEHRVHSRRYTTWIIRDVTARHRIERERRHLEQQLHIMQRMESIGQLTGGIAHDFNNLLVAINGYTDLALDPNLPPEQLPGYLLEIRQAGKRAALMTQKLLTFSRKQQIEPSLVNVNELIRELKVMIERLLPENISIRFSPSLHDPSVLADAGQIEQALVNLAVNARDAMPDGGHLVISVDQQDAGTLAFSPITGSAREYTVIRVEDTGRGMSDDVRKRIFEPFFTTKPEEEGTGLGLSVVYGIVKQHEGHIEVSSQANKGTRFEVYLPMADSRRPPVKQERSNDTAATVQGSETILLVEDNAQVRELARLVLISSGYRIVEAQDGVEALDIFKDEQNEIALVIMDVVMPRMGGREVMTRLRQIRPDIRILFTSGYSKSGIYTRFIFEEGLDFIEKPYDAETLRRRVRTTLDEQPRNLATFSEMSLVRSR